MTPNKNSKSLQNSVTRRDFLKTTATSAASAAMLASGNYAFAAGSDVIKMGIIGCGGRGSGAVVNACESSQGVELVAMADLFSDHLENKKKGFKEGLGDKFKVKDDHCFTGFDAYKNLLATDCNYVILATPPGYRPIHLRAAVDAGKNVFFEKPVAVDGPGVRTVIEAGELAKAKGLSVVTGTQRRHQPPYLEAMKRIHDGMIGEITGGQIYWNGGGLWMFPRQAGWSDSEWMHRNWYYFTWLCGDHIVEQHVHNIDVMNWAMGGPPVRAMGMGGRQVRTGPEFGHIYDHFACEFEFANGARFLSTCRHHDNTPGNVSERIVGTKGRTHTADGNRYTITPYSGEAWNYKGPTPNPYVVEHADNIAAIRAGKPLNEARRIAESTCTAILGREACYTGQEVSFNQVLNCKTVLMPPNTSFGATIPVPPVAMPGKTKLERAWNE